MKQCMSGRQNGVRGNDQQKKLNSWQMRASPVVVPPIVPTASTWPPSLGEAAAQLGAPACPRARRGCVVLHVSIGNACQTSGHIWIAKACLGSS
eukprot:1507975-Pleurochrysis_carterae.AAC.1